METKKRVLEIGHGGFPIGSSGIRPFIRKLSRSGVEYYGIESPLASTIENSVAKQRGFQILKRVSIIERNNSNIYRLETRCSSLNPKDMHLMRMNARNLEFTNQFFDEVHLHYFVTQPDVTYEDSVKAIGEAKRVFKEDGCILVSGEAIKTRFRDEPGEITAGRAIVENGLAIEKDPKMLRTTVFYDEVMKMAKSRAEIVTDCLGNTAGAFIFLARK